MDKRSRSQVVNLFGIGRAASMEDYRKFLVNNPVAARKIASATGDPGKSDKTLKRRGSANTSEAVESTVSGSLALLGIHGSKSQPPSRANGGIEGSQRQPVSTSKPSSMRTCKGYQTRQSINAEVRTGSHVNASISTSGLTDPPRRRTLSGICCTRPQRTIGENGGIKQSNKFRTRQKSSRH
ncbi:protein V57 [Felid alphaherpesvirus 1]|nr:protein V57 [Felid alphaherpesvirus 1]ALJ85185.1 protein V57 [Felid alphaherpesvirus 1]ALJ85261.1 protein V57 [Felid alphaherpesvirus 1]ALJ85337.1 protein V57 [Felid alphaherpesvirus 1]ALJ85413.1 protein V57 [Felid alphaherpesvirus 1]